MLTERLNIFEYEEILMGQKKNFVCSFKGGFKENCIEVGNIWRYAVTRLLKWTPEEAVAYMTDEIVDTLCLDKTFVGIGFERSSRYISDYRFILQYAFPDKVHFDLRKQAIAEYERVAKLGTWANDETTYKFPKKFFLDTDGISRSAYLLTHVVSLYLGDLSLEEKYDFFSDQKKAAKWLSGKKLDMPLKLIFKTPLEYFHYSLPFDEKDNLLFYTGKINEEYNKELQSIIKKEKKK